MSTPTEPNSADRALADKLARMIAGDIDKALTKLFGSVGPDFVEKIVADQVNIFAPWIASHRASAVAEAVGPLEKELAKAHSMLAAVDLNRSGWAPSFIDEVTERACKGPHKGPAELLVEACNTVDSTRKALTTAESDRDSLAALVVRMREEIANARKGMSAGYHPCDPEDILDKALALVPADLADCVVVKRGELERTPDLGKLMRDAHAQYVRPSTLWHKFIDGTPLNNDISVWMAEFARDAILADRAALRPEAKGGA